MLEPYREEEDITGVYMEDCGGWRMSSGYSSVARRWQLESKALVSTLKNDQFISHRDTPMKQEE